MNTVFSSLKRPHTSGPEVAGWTFSMEVDLNNGVFEVWQKDFRPDGSVFQSSPCWMCNDFESALEKL